MKNATLADRFKAFMIDWVFWIIITLGIYFTLQLFTNNTVILKSLLFPFSFWILFKDLVGNGIGKSQVKLQVIYTATHKKVINPFVLIIRNLTIILWFIDIPMLFFGSDNKRLGEKITNTKVVKISNVGKK